MNAYPASFPSNTQHHIHMSSQSDKAIAFAAAVRALNHARQQQQSQPLKQAFTPMESPEACSEAVNFCLKIGVQAMQRDALHIRALVTSVDKDFTVMTFPAQRDSFLWELNLPPGNYRLEVKGNNAEGGLTTADIEGNVLPGATHDSSEEENYVMHMNFVIA